MTSWVLGKLVGVSLYFGEAETADQDLKALAHCLRLEDSSPRNRLNDILLAQSLESYIIGASVRRSFHCLIGRGHRGQGVPARGG